nr:ribosomal protein S10 [Lithodesmioides sp. mgcode 4]
MFININISSKDLTSLNLFLIFFLKLLNSKKLKVKLFKKVKTVLKKKKSFTVLKSPHVNKSAQEQFKYELFNYKLCVYSFQLLKVLYIIKHINNAIIPNVNILLKFFFNYKGLNKKLFKSLNSDNCFFILTNTLKIPISKYLEILSFYGEKKFNKFLLFK